ncbi:MAG: NAD(P)-binding protein, partial [Halanaerobiales bacterium]|nr:NAD(P)-binding protein [Halanaerobiales bacterium]
MNKKVVIVGAGPGGLSAGMILASRGYQVEIFEKNKVVGGRSAALRLGDFTFDTGPTFLMM